MLRFIVFFGVLLSVLGAVNYFVHRRASAAFNLKKRGRRILFAIQLAAAIVFVVGRAVRALPVPIAEALGTFGSTIELAVLFAGVFLVPERIATGVAALVARLKSSSQRRAEEEPEATEPQSSATPKLPRRELMSRALAGSAVTLGAGVAGYGVLFGRHDYAIEEVPVKLSGLPPSLDGFTIVQLSDIHIGTYVGEREIRSAIELVGRAKPDLIVLTGDLIDHDLRFTDLLGRLVRRLSEKAPVAAVPGNHDYYAGLSETVSTLRDAGADVLINRGKIIGAKGGKFALLGVDDVWSRRFGRGPDIAKAIASVPSDAARVLLCHNPAYFPEAAPHVDLQLSGHTHGGQVNLGGIRPVKLLVPYGYIEGRYERNGAQLWVNRGFGTAGPPARVCAAPEVTKIVLTSV
ncbi:metallophosphoesterase [Desulfobulbus sp. AH-315-M07]|nr:metallophosphoesterase [Desulfobulbus sp. AH-315-M07]